MADFLEIPGYKIVSVLGEGGGATVYLGIQEKLDRKVAIKILKPFYLKNKVTAERFEKEAKTVAKLSHTNIIQIFDTGKSDDHHYIVMEYLEESLTNWMRRQSQGRMDPGLALDIVEKLMAALDYAHFLGIYHRDIKPDNIMFRQDSTPVLVDFGIASLYKSPEDLPKSGMFMGTIEYMSPEQCKSRKEVDGRSDIYSLGVVLFEMLTGERPYKAESQVSMALKHIEEPVPRLPEELSRYQPLIDKMMAKDKKKRLASGAEFLLLYDKIMFGPLNSTHQPIESFPTPPVEPPPKKPIESTLSQTEKTTASASKKTKSFAKTLSEKPPDLTKKRRHALIDNIKIKEKWTSFKKFLGRKKVIWPLTAGLIICLIIIMVKPFSRTDQSFVSILIDKGSQFCNQNLTLAHELSEKNDLESLKKGKSLIDALKKINTTPELNALAEKFTNRINKLEEEFDKNLADAKRYIEQDNFLKAKESILRAKRIKVTQGLKLFERGIDIYVKGQNYLERTEDEKKKDDRAYRLATSKNIIEAYEKYLEEFPVGTHAINATKRLEQLIEAAQKKFEGKLRSNYDRDLEKNETAAMIRRYNFFDSKLNRYGRFKGYYESMEKDGGKVIIDQKTGLMWYNGETSEAMNLENAEEWIEKLNSNKYGGYDDWRLPTLEEAASLLRKRRNPKRLHIDPEFSGNQQKVWTNDSSTPKKSLSRKKIWIVRFDYGRVETSLEENKLHVLPVRSLK